MRMYIFYFFMMRNPFKAGSSNLCKASPLYGSGNAGPKELFAPNGSSCVY